MNYTVTRRSDKRKRAWKMIIVQVAGGLGNQLQQYALYRKLIRLGKEARLDFSWFQSLEEKKKSGTVTGRELELDYFDRLVYEACTREEREKLIGGEDIVGKFRRKFFSASVRWFHESRMYHPEIFEFEDMYLSGYFACEKYYADIMYDLREKIQFPPSQNPLNREMAVQMQACNSASVHIRRGDYLNPENKAMFGNICTPAYYEKALEVMRQMVPGVHFYVFSDDIPYVKKEYEGEDFTVVDINHGKESFYDMWLMSQCRHNICANSTFSFWGARLNSNEDKVIIRPTIQKNGQVFVKEEMEELWRGWKFVSPEGKLA